MAQPKQISQETFDAVVRENVEEFEMDLGEAIQDAKEQFKTQGVDLSNLITSYIVDPDTGDLKHTNPVKGNVYAGDASRERVFFLALQNWKYVSGITKYQQLNTLPPLFTLWLTFSRTSQKTKNAFDIQ